MAGFLYFVAGRQKVAIEQARELGLGYALDNCTSVEINGNNPSKKAGCVFGDTSFLPKGETLGMYVDRQAWRKMPTVDGPELWLGYWTEHKPAPEELRRETKLRTHGVLLDDGNYWDVPIVGHREESGLASDLPAYMDIDDEGRRVRGKELAEYRELWETVADLADRYFAAELGEGEQPTDDEQWDVTVTLLQAVYRVGPVELVTLETFLEHSDRFATVWMVATAYEFLRAMIAAAGQKKTSTEAGDGGSTSAGEAA